MIITEIKKDEDILLWLKGWTLESDREFKIQHCDLHHVLSARRRLADKESHGGFKHKIEEENQEDQHQDELHSRHDIKEDKDILLRLNDSLCKSVNEASKCKKEQKDLDRYLNGHQGLADKESDGGFIKEENQEALHEDASHSGYTIKEDEDFILRFMESVRESVNAADKLRKDQNDLHGDSNGRFDSAPDLLEELEEILLKFYELIDHILPMLKDAQKARFELQDNFDFLEKVRDLLLTSSQRVDKLIDELESMKNDENQGEDSSLRKTQNPEILVQLVELNAHLVERSFHHGISFLFNDNCTENESSSYVDELKWAKENMAIVLLRIRELRDQET